MSVDWLSRAWEEEVGSPTQKAVLICLADRADEYGRCFSSYRDMVRRTEFGKTAIREALAELEVAGFIERYVCDRRDGSQSSNEWQLLYWRDAPKPPEGGVVRRQQGVARRHPPGRETAPRVPPGGTRTEPSREPSREGVHSRGAGRPGGDGPKRRFRPNRADDETAGSDDESPALGADRTRPSRAERDARARERGRSGTGLALHFKERLYEEGMRGSRAVVDVGQFATRLVALSESGLDWELLRTMVDIYCKNPDRYSRRDQKAWVGFLTHAPKIEQAAKSMRKSSASAEELYGNPYEGID